MHTKGWALFKIARLANLKGCGLGSRTVGIRTALMVLLYLITWVVGVFMLPASTAPIRDASGTVAATGIASIECIGLNGPRQSLVIRRRNVHGGPGNPETTALIHYDQALEDDFVVVLWLLQAWTVMDRLSEVKSRSWNGMPRGLFVSAGTPDDLSESNTQRAARGHRACRAQPTDGAQSTSDSDRQTLFESGFARA